MTGLEFARLTARLRDIALAQYQNTSPTRQEREELIDIGNAFATELVLVRQTAALEPDSYEAARLRTIAPARLEELTGDHGAAGL